MKSVLIALAIALMIACTTCTILAWSFISLDAGLLAAVSFFIVVVGFVVAAPSLRKVG